MKVSDRTSRIDVACLESRRASHGQANWIGVDTSLQLNDDRPNPLTAEGAVLAQSLRAMAAPASDVTLDAMHFGPVGPQTLAFGTIRVEKVESSALIAHHGAWADLCGRTLEPNIFLDPSFALPLFQHIHYPQRPSFVLVWEASGPVAFDRLLGLFPIELRRRSVALGGIARGLLHEQMGCGTPLIDRHRAADVLGALVDWLWQEQASVGALLFPGVMTEGPFLAALRDHCARADVGLVSLDEHERAVLRRPAPGIAVCHASTKRRKERARQNRRLSETGVRAYRRAESPADVAVAAERFLALEHNGWKGNRGTALLSTPTSATFTRTAMRLLAHDEKCRIDSIEIDGRPVAMGIVITTGDRAYFWKTAFDETYAPLSPGVQFAIELTREQLADTRLASTDSCAVANHPMIDKLWPERWGVADVMIGLDHRDGRRFARAVRTERLRRMGRRQAKRLWHALRRFDPR